MNYGLNSGSKLIIVYITRKPISSAFQWYIAVIPPIKIKGVTTWKMKLGFGTKKVTLHFIGKFWYLKRLAFLLLAVGPDVFIRTI